MKVQSENNVSYTADTPDEDEAIIQHAIEIIKLKRFKRDSDPLQSPGDVRRYLQVLLGHHESEVFGLLTMDNRNRVIHFHEMFRGTVDAASVYPREIVKQALADNAAAVILTHNHPSGVTNPSGADERITRDIRDALALVDIRVLDHFIIGSDVYSFAEHGLL
jgi:DNA repair protein RadC